MASFLYYEGLLQNSKDIKWMTWYFAPLFQSVAAYQYLIIWLPLMPCVAVAIIDLNRYNDKKYLVCGLLNSY